MRLLITGGAGFIGSNFIHYWKRRYPDDHITNLDALTYAGNLESLTGISESANYCFIKGSITNPEIARQSMENVDVVVHFAAESFVDRSIVGPQLFVETNILGSQILFDAAREANIGKFVLVSTDEVYGSLGPTGYFTESSPYAPNNPYSASKAAADLIAISYYRTYGFPLVISHCSNNYGPFQFPEKFIPLFILHALAGKQLPLYGDGLNIRDWIHVDDHCRGLEAIINNGRVGETYNFGGDCERTNLEIAKRICELTDVDESRITFVKDRPGHDKRYAIDFTKATRELGFVPQILLDNALPELIDWYKSHEEWVAHVQSGAYRDFYEKWYADRSG